MTYRKIMPRQSAWRLLVWLLVLLPLVVPPTAAADPDRAQVSSTRLIEHLNRATGNRVQLVRRSGNGPVSMIGTDPGHAITPARPGSGATMDERRARGFLNEYGSLMGISDAESNLRLQRIRNATQGRRVVRFQQTQGGLPVFGGELLVQLNAARQVICTTGKILSRLPADTSPRITAAQAAATARRAMARAQQVDDATLTASAPELWLYDPELWGPTTLRSALVWRLEVMNGTDIRELVLVDAENNTIVLHFNQVTNAEQRKIYDAGDTYADPGTLVRSEGDGPSGIAEADTAYLYLGYTYAFYATEHGRNGVDNAGMTETAVVRFRDPESAAADTDYENAYFNAVDAFYFGKGFANALDVVAHEYTHGVTQNESNLIYCMQSGAINESFSDIWGEFVNLTYEPPTAANRWLIGENCPLGVLRSMKDPTVFGDPDRMRSPYYLGENFSDRGGVHTNCGVGNKACYLITDGDNFNGYTVTGIGIAKAADLYYEVQTNLLTCGSDYEDLANALQQAALNLGYSAAEKASISNAIAAVEMTRQSIFYTPAAEVPLTDSGEVRTIFFDDMENPLSGNWAFGANLGPGDWCDTTGNAASGSYSLRGGYLVEYAGDFYATMTFDAELPVGVPSYLHFKHNHQFEVDSYDGGVVEYSKNSGASWIDARTLFLNNGYTGVIGNSSGNPLGGRHAFVNYSPDYYASRIDLSMLAGARVRFRFRIGTDAGGGNLGWSIDDFRIYSVTPAPPGIPWQITVFPNPYRPNDGDDGTGVAYRGADDGSGIYLRGLVPGMRLEIFDARGRLVREMTVPAGSSEVQWDVRNRFGDEVVSGVYLIVCSTDSDRVVEKLFIIR